MMVGYSKQIIEDLALKLIDSEKPTFEKFHKDQIEIKASAALETQEPVSVRILSDPLKKPTYILLTS